MIATKSVSFRICCVLLTGLLLAGTEPDPAPTGETSRVHKSTAQSDPERVATTEETKSKTNTFRIDRSAIASEEWQEAIRRGLSHLPRKPRGRLWRWPEHPRPARTRRHRRHTTRKRWIGRPRKPRGWRQ